MAQELTSTSTELYAEIFHDASLPFEPGLKGRKLKGAALGCQASAWGCCMAGHKPPDDFGKGMVMLQEITGVAAPDDVSKAIDDFMGKK